MYNNDNRSRNSGTWVYMNGELYHAGIKGMKWGKHLPGTDWWKKLSGEFRRGVTTYENEQRRANAATVYQTNQSKRTDFPNRVQSNNGATYAYNSRTEGSTMSNIRRPSSFGYKAKMYGTVAGRMAKRRLDKAGKAISTTASKVANSKAVNYAKHKVSQLRDKAVAGKNRAKQYLSNIGGKALSVIRNRANSYKDKVNGFLDRMGLSSKRKITLEGKPMSTGTGSKSLTGKPIETKKASGQERRRPASKAEQAAAKVENSKSKPVNRSISITSQRSPYYRG